MHRTPAQLDSAAGLWIEALILGVLSVAPLRRTVGVVIDWRPGNLVRVDTTGALAVDLRLRRDQGAAFAMASALGCAINWEPNDCAFGWSEDGR